MAYKPNLAFYESMGIAGWQSLEKTMKYLEQYKGEVFTIADAKRGDIGNTSTQYAKAFFETLPFDAATFLPPKSQCRCCEGAAKRVGEYRGKAGRPI